MSDNFNLLSKLIIKERLVTFGKNILSGIEDKTTVWTERFESYVLYPFHFYLIY